MFAEKRKETSTAVYKKSHFANDATWNILQCTTPSLNRSCESWRKANREDSFNEIWVQSMKWWVGVVKVLSWKVAVWKQKFHAWLNDICSSICAVQALPWGEEWRLRHIEFCWGEKMFMVGNWEIISSRQLSCRHRSLLISDCIDIS